MRQTAKNENIKFFDIQNGIFLCGNCSAKPRQNTVEITSAMYNTIDYIVSSEIKRVFSFSLGEKSLRYLAGVGEACVRNQLEYDFKTLKYLNNVRDL